MACPKMLAKTIACAGAVRAPHIQNVSFWPNIYSSRAGGQEDFIIYVAVSEDQHIPCTCRRLGNNPISAFVVGIELPVPGPVLAGALLTACPISSSLTNRAVKPRTRITMIAHNTTLPKNALSTLATPMQTNKAVKPRTAASTSIPGMLGLFHDEWDALMLETHSLRTSLNSVRQELSHALYQHDSACRVIARVMRERDEARAALSAVRETVEAEVAAKRSAPGGAAAGAEGASAAAAADAAPAKKARVNEIPEAVVRELAEVNAALSKPRKKRPVSESLASIDSFSTMALLGSHALHKVAAAGITSLDVQPGSKGSVVASGGADSTVQVYDVAASRVLASLEGHGKRVSAVSWLSPEVLLSSSTDKTVRVWQAPRDGGSSYR